MPLILLDAYPSGQVVVNTDDIVLIEQSGTHPEIVLRNCERRIFVPHSSVADVAAALDDRENLVIDKLSDVGGG